MSTVNAVLVDAGGTNIGSVLYALERLGVRATTTADPGQIRAASHVILPGVGAAGPGMQRLRSSGLDEVIRALEQPVLGVCLGMQLLFEHSEEGNTECLGILSGRVRRIPARAGYAVPHMGWNRLAPLCEDAMLVGLPEVAHAYFVHSYAVTGAASTLATVDYGSPLAAIVRQGNFCGMQFHPERSSALGALLLRNFLAL